jgi:hypothetical protein
MTLCQSVLSPCYVILSCALGTDSVTKPSRSPKSMYHPHARIRTAASIKSWENVLSIIVIV